MKKIAPIDSAAKLQSPTEVPTKVDASSTLRQWQIEAIKRGIEEADRGDFISHAALKAVWQKRLAAAEDAARQPSV